MQSDIAVIKVNDTNRPLSNLRAACLPRANNNAEEAIHAGWSEPPPFYYVQSEASGYTPYYRNSYFHLQLISINPILLWYLLEVNIEN